MVGSHPKTVYDRSACAPKNTVTCQARELRHSPEGRPPESGAAEVSRTIGVSLARGSRSRANSTTTAVSTESGTTRISSGVRQDDPVASASGTATAGPPAAPKVRALE